MLEKDLEKYLVTRCKQNNLICIKGNPFGVRGYPDRLIFGGNIYYVELKLGKLNGSNYGLTAMQKKWKKVIEQSKAKYALIESKEDIDTLVSEIVAEYNDLGIINPFCCMVTKQGENK